MYRRGVKRRRNYNSPYVRANKLARLRGAARRSVMRTGGNYSQTIPRLMGSRQVTSQGPERKYIDFKTDLIYAFGAADTACGAVSGIAASPQLLNGCVTGADVGNRLGRKITMKSLQWRIAVQCAPTTTSGQIRTIIFLDNQANATTPTAAEFFEDSAAALLLTSPLNLNNRERFKIIADKISNLGQEVATQAWAPTQVYLKGYKKLNVDTIYNAANGGTVADITTNALHVWTMGSLGVANPTVSSYFRVRFTDA